MGATTMNFLQMGMTGFFGMLRLLGKEKLMYDIVRSRLAAAVPFAKFVGVELLEIGDGVAKARLVQRPDISNHIATMHAGALFTLGETASGATVAGAFVDLIAKIRPVAAEANIIYKKVARGMIDCSAATSEPAAVLRQRLRQDGKVAFNVQVEMINDEKQVVATMAVGWDVRIARPKR